MSASPPAIPAPGSGLPAVAAGDGSRRARRQAGRGLLQTFQPDHPILRAILSGDAERFYREEIAMRQEGELPPFGRMAGVIISGEDRIEAEKHARAGACRAWARSCRTSCAGACRSADRDDPRPPPLPLLVRGPREADIQLFLRAMLAAAPKPRGSVRVNVDVDPMSFM